LGGFWAITPECLGVQILRALRYVRAHMPVVKYLWNSASRLRGKGVKSVASY